MDSEIGDKFLGYGYEYEDKIVILVTKTLSFTCLRRLKKKAGKKFLTAFLKVLKIKISYV